MRDVWVAFISDPDPAPQITSLRGQISARHALMYEAVSDVVELRQKFTDRLNGWTAISPKTIRRVELIPTSGRDVLRAASLCLEGQKLVELGLPDQGLSKLGEASALGGPPENLTYARFLARRGDLGRAEIVIQSAIDYFTSGPGTLNSPLAAEVFAASAGVLRRQGRNTDAIGRLEQALTLFSATDAFARSVRCRILDDLGLACQKTSETDRARRYMNEALEIRREAADDVGICQSLVNLARLDVAAGELETALGRADDALARLAEIPVSALHANAHVLRAQVLLRLNDAQGAVGNTLIAISLNEQFGNDFGTAISYYVAAQCYRSLGKKDEARRHAEKSAELNESMGNTAGRDKALWILSQLDAL